MKNIILKIKSFINKNNNADLKKFFKVSYNSNELDSMYSEFMNSYDELDFYSLKNITTESKPETLLPVREENELYDILEKKFIKEIELKPYFINNIENYNDPDKSYEIEKVNFRKFQEEILFHFNFIKHLDFAG